MSTLFSYEKWQNDPIEGYVCLSFWTTFQREWPEGQIYSKLLAQLPKTKSSEKLG
jgi:hypothetical protein